MSNKSMTPTEVSTKHGILCRVVEAVPGEVTLQISAQTPTTFFSYVALDPGAAFRLGRALQGMAHEMLGRRVSV